MEDQLTLSLVPPSPVPSTSPFLSLAPELKQAIFSALPDISTLSSLVSTCSTFYHTFRDAEPLIIKSILHNQIGSHLLFDALIVLESRTLVSYNEETVAQLLDSYAERALTITSNYQKLRLRHAVAISSLYDAIDCLSEDFACMALATNIVTGLDEPSPTPLSALESNRIKRAFYRYELYNSLFRELEELGLEWSASKKLQDSFFEMCEPWENEQLRCVRDYLFERLLIRMCPWKLYDQVKELISLAYDDVAWHDVEWAKSDPSFKCCTEYYLALSLSNLHQLFNTSTFNERCQLLEPREMWPDYSLKGSLDDVISIQILQAYGNNQMDLNVDHFSTESSMSSDKGPEEAWRWANIIEMQWSSCEPRRTLRKRGYVMWDFARLAEWGLLDEDFTSIPHEDDGADLMLSRRIDELHDSCKARREIWDRGGRGWWSPEDESRIVWPPGGPIEVSKERNRDLDLDDWFE